MKELDNMSELREEEIEKVAGGVPLLHPVRHYEAPPEEEPTEGGYEGTW